MDFFRASTFKIHLFVARLTFESLLFHILRPAAPSKGPARRLSRRPRDPCASLLPSIPRLGADLPTLTPLDLLSFAPKFCNDVSQSSLPSCATLTNGYYTTHVSVDIQVLANCTLKKPVLLQGAGSTLLGLKQQLFVSGASFSGFNFLFTENGLIASSSMLLSISASTLSAYKSPIITSSSGQIAFNDLAFLISSPSATLLQPVVSFQGTTFNAHNISVASQDAPAQLSSFLSATASTVNITGSRFTGFSANRVIDVSNEAGGAFWMSNTTFEGLGTHSKPLDSVLALQNIAQVYLSGVHISTSDAIHGLFVSQAAVVNVTASSFTNITSPTVCAGMSLNDVSQSSLLQDLTFRHNSFGEWWTACITSSSSPAMTLDAKRIVFDGNINPSTVPLYEMTGWSFLVQGNIKATLQDLNFDGESKYFASVGIVGANAVVLPNAQMSGNITWRGFVVLCGALSFDDDADMFGRILLSRANGSACSELNTVDLRGNTLRLVDPFESSPEERNAMSDHWLQTAHFKNGTIFINTPRTTVCCDMLLDDALYSDSVNLTSLTLHANTSLTWGASKTGFFLTDDASRLIIEDAGSIVQTRPESSDNPRTIISGAGSVEVRPGGRVFAASLDFKVSSFDLQDGATLYVYPSNWSQIAQHAAFQSSSLSGLVTFMPDYLTADFTPNLFYNLESRTFTPYGGFQVIKAPGIPLDGLSTSGVVNFVFGSSTGPALPSTITPVVTLSDDLASVIIDFPIPISPSDAVPCPELDFVSMGYNAAFNYSCIWQNSTRVVVYLQSIQILQPFALLPSSVFEAVTILAPEPSSIPVALDIAYYFDSCGVLYLSSQNSQYGSLKVSGLSWSVTCGIGAIGACASTSVDRVTPTFSFSTFDLSASVYVATVSVQANGAVYSLSKEILLPSSLLQVSIDGPAWRTVLTSSGLTLFSSFNLADSCPGAPKMIYAWNTGSIATGKVRTNSPSLFVPNSALSSSLNPDIFYEIILTVSTVDHPTDYLSATSVFVKFADNPTLLTSATNRYVFNSLTSEVALSVETQPSLADKADTRYVWTIFECPNLNAGTRFRPVVGLNLTIPEAFKCQFSNGSTFDGPFITAQPRLSLPSSPLISGVYGLQVTRTTLSAIEEGLITTELSTKISFVKSSDVATAWAEIIIPPIRTLRASQRLPARLQINDGTQVYTGTEITKNYEVQWSVLAPRLVSLSEDQTNKATLIVPFDAVLTGDVTLQVALTPKKRTLPPLFASRGFSLGTGPTGGYISIERISSRTLRLSTLGWTSHIGQTENSTLTYQFFCKNTETGVSLALSDIPSVGATLDVPVTPSSSYEFTAIAYDAARRSGASISQTIFTPADSRKSEKSLERSAQQFSDSLESAINASDWKALQSIVVQQLATLRFPSLTRSELLNASLQIASSLPSSESAASSSLGQIDALFNLEDSNEASVVSQLDAPTQEALLKFVSSTLNSTGSRFGSASASSLSSSKSLMSILNAMLIQAPASILNATENPNQQIILSLLSNHSLQVLSQLFPDETVAITPSSTLSLTAGKVSLLTGDSVQVYPRPSRGSPSSPNSMPASSPSSSTLPATSAPLTTPSSLTSGPDSIPSPNPSPADSTSPASPSATPSESDAPVGPTISVIISSTPVEGYIGFTHTAFENGSYPNPSDILAVSVLQFSTSGANISDLDATKTYATTTDVPSGGVILPTTTTGFTVKVVPKGMNPACATYDAQRGQWVAASGCKTGSSNGQVSCTCTNGGPPTLSVIFQVDNGIAKSGGKRGLSTLGIVMLAIFMSVLFLLIATVLICLLVPGARKIARPYSKRAHGFS